MTVDDPGVPIGDVAKLAGVATSTLRYYDRLGLVPADLRVSGHRRYTGASIRRLTFVQMLQDAGLSLDDIAGVLDAPDNEAWKAVARTRLELLEREIEQLARSRDLLELSLLCRFDHPLDECQVMNDEIDRRLERHPTRKYE